MRIVQLFVIIAAIAFGLSKLLLFSGFGVDPEILWELRTDESGVGAFAWSIGFILGTYFFLIPFIVAYIRRHVHVWWILALLLGTPLVAGFLFGLMGAGPVGLAFVNTVLTPIAWVGALVWSILNPGRASKANSDSY